MVTEAKRDEVELKKVLTLEEAVDHINQTRSQIEIDTLLFSELPNGIIECHCYSSSAFYSFAAFYFSSQDIGQLLQLINEESSSQIEYKNIYDEVCRVLLEQDIKYIKYVENGSFVLVDICINGEELEEQVVTIGTYKLSSEEFDRLKKHAENKYKLKIRFISSPKVNTTQESTAHPVILFSPNAVLIKPIRERLTSIGVTEGAMLGFDSKLREIVSYLQKCTDRRQVLIMVRQTIQELLTRFEEQNITYKEILEVINESGIIDFLPDLIRVIGDVFVKKIMEKRQS